MRPVNLATSDASGGTQTTSVCPMDIRIAPFQASLSAVVTGAATYTVEYTEDDVWSSSFNPSTATWRPVTGMSAVSATSEATIISPVTGIRMRQTAGAGSVALRIVQAGN